MGEVGGEFKGSWSVGSLVRPFDSTLGDVGGDFLKVLWGFRVLRISMKWMKMVTF